MNLQEELKALKQRIAELEEQDKDQREFPQDGDEYHYIEATMCVEWEQWDESWFDLRVQEIGNIFKTKEQAEFAVEKLKVEAELRKFSTEYQPYAEIYNIVFHNNSKKVITVTGNQTFQDITFYFESEEKAKEAIETVGEERIKKYIFGVED